MRYRVCVKPERIEWAWGTLPLVGSVESFSRDTTKAELLAQGGEVAGLAERLPEPDGCFIVESRYEDLLKFFSAWLKVIGIGYREPVPSGISIAVVQ